MKPRPKAPRCECPERANVMPNMIDWYSKEEKLGMNHEPNKCLCINRLKQYKRRDKILWLCSCCHLPGDEEVKNVPYSWEKHKWHHVEEHKQKPQTQPQEKATFYPTEFANRIRADEKAKILQEILKFMDNVNKVYHTTPTELKIRRYLEAELKETK